MAVGNTFRSVFKIIALVLRPALKLITAKFREELETWLNRKYAEALETENPWDDWLFEMLATALGITLTTPEE